MPSVLTKPATVIDSNIESPYDRADQRDSISNFHELAKALIVRATILGEYRAFILERSDRATLQQLENELDSLLAGAILLLYDAPGPCEDHSFILTLQRVTSTLMERARTLASKSDDELRSDFIKLQPQLQKSDIIAIERKTLWALASLDSELLRGVEIDEDDVVVKGIGGLHLTGTPLSIVDFPERKNRSHELVHNVNDTFGALQHDIPARRLKHAYGANAKAIDLATLVSNAINDLHEELVAHLLSPNQHDHRTMRDILLSTLNREPETKWNLSTAGRRIRDLINKINDQNSPVPSEDRAAMVELVERNFFRAASSAANALAAAQLCGEEIYVKAAMLLYLLRPTQWSSLRGILCSGLPDSKIEKAFGLFDTVLSPWDPKVFGRIEEYKNHFEHSIYGIGELALERSIAPNANKGIDTPAKLEEAEKHLNTLSAAFGTKEKTWWYIEALRKEFDRRYPHFFPERAAARSK